jgi:hypothetical protein
MAGTLDKNQLTILDAPDIPYLAGTFEPTPTQFKESKWLGECPGCAKLVSGEIKFLGQKVTCKCGVRFFFPWWNLVSETVSGLPQGFYVPPRSADRLGVTAENGDQSA